ncbi:MAG: hypothetical protein QM537_07045 [Candidatus Symbiobacter sp.]|nr:hypothetical protein [Candidatus Symbiobacter sp.]
MRKFKDSHWAAIHELASNMHKFGLVNDQEMQDYDQMCLAPNQPTNLDQKRAGGQKLANHKSRRKHEMADNAPQAA